MLIQSPFFCNLRNLGDFCVLDICFKDTVPDYKDSYLTGRLIQKVLLKMMSYYYKNTGILISY